MTDGIERKDQGAGAKKPTLTLNRTQSGGTVKQSFSHGRSKQVAVEVKTKRTIGAPPGGAAAPSAPGPGVPRNLAGPRPAPAAPAAPKTSAASPAQARDLSQDEQRRRQEAVQRAVAEDRARRERQAAEDEARRAREEQERRMEEERQAHERALAAQAAAEVAQLAPAEAPPAKAPAAAKATEDTRAEPTQQPASGGSAADLLSELGGRVKRAKPMPVAPVKPAKPTRGEPLRRAGKLTLDMVERMTEGDDEKVRSLAAMRRAREKERERRMGAMRGQDSGKVVRDVVVPEVITVQELANRMAERVADVVKYLMKQGQMVRVNDTLDADTAELIVTDFGHSVKRVAESDIEIGLEGDADAPETLTPRPPVVTVMGHVDHGKTSLLDSLRQSDVAAGEAGGITQHIGAYQVRLKDGQRVTFLDTPGHAAFSSMRARGAQVTDIVVLVVAADDGVMPQTIEAINHAKAAGVPMIVAVNKIDKPDAKPERVVNELLQHEIVAESLGGETQIVNVSAIKRTGLDDLVETILLQAEILDLKANPDRSAEAVVVEAKLDRGRGPVATVLVQRGTLKRGDIVVAGAAWGRVRALVNERGQQISAAGPSEPAEIMGLEGVPDPGDQLVVVENENRAREVVEYRQRVKREKAGVGGGGPRASLEQMMARFKDNTAKELPVVIKADVQGSAEAISGALEKLGTEEVRARVLQSTVGAINEADITLAKASGAPVIGFNVRASKEARDLAEREGVEIRYYAIIYDVIDDIKGVMSGMLAPIQRETFLGTSRVLEVFQISKIGRVAGCRVEEGKMQRGARIRLLRDNVVIHEGGKLNTLKRFKDDVNEVQTGQECGMSFENYQDIKQGDVVECYLLETVQRSL
jgi:translation initiation factor IF-2